MKKYFSLRPIIQIFFFVLTFAITFSKWLVSSDIVIPILSKISLHAVCPFGGVVSIYTFFSTGAYVQKIHDSSMVLMVLSIFIALLFGAILCGYICPFGTLQEWIGKFGKRLFPNKYNKMIPQKLDSFLRYGRYIILIMVIYFTATTTKLVFQDWDPYYAFFNFFTGEIALTAFVILGVTVLLSLIIERPWCKYFCPYCAVLGIFNTFRIFQIKRNKSTCINCKKCDKACPMNIEVSKKEVVRNHQCIACHQCTSDQNCPVEDTVEIALIGGKNHEA